MQLDAGPHQPRHDQHRPAPDPRRRHRQVGRPGGAGRDPAHRPAARRHVRHARADEGRAHPAGRGHRGRRAPRGGRSPRAEGEKQAAILHGRGRQAAPDPRGRGRGRGHPGRGRRRAVPPADGRRGRGRRHPIGLRRHPRRRPHRRPHRHQVPRGAASGMANGRPPRSSCPPSWRASPGRSPVASCSTRRRPAASPDDGAAKPPPRRLTPDRRCSAGQDPIATVRRRSQRLERVLAGVVVLGEVPAAARSANMRVALVRTGRDELVAGLEPHVAPGSVQVAAAAAHRQHVEAGLDVELQLGQRGARGLRSRTRPARGRPPRRSRRARSTGSGGAPPSPR